MITKTIRAKSVDHFRDLLPISGVFEMSDCEAEIQYPEFATTEDLTRITNFLESTIHVTDVRVTASTSDDLNDKDRFTVIINEVGPNRPKYTKRNR